MRAISLLTSLIIYQLIFTGIVLSQVQVFQFNPRYNGDEFDVSTIKFSIKPVEASPSAAAGITVCLRANFQYLNEKCLFKGKSQFDFS